MDYHIMDFNTLIKRIRMYMSKFEGDYPDWFIGIAKDLDQDLFELHNVDENGIWISFGADTEEIAKNVERYFMDKKTDGKPAKLEDDTRIVYVYKKNSKTTP